MDPTVKPWGIGKRLRCFQKVITGVENGKRTPHRNNLKSIKRALEDAGVEFIPANGGGPGVRLK